MGKQVTFCKHGVPSGAHCRWCTDGNEIADTTPIARTEAERNASRAAHIASAAKLGIKVSQ